MQDSVAVQSSTVKSLEYALAKLIASAKITNTEIGAKLSLKIARGIAVKAPIKIGE